MRNAYNQFWWDYGTKLTEDHRTSLIVEPRDGKIPALTPGAQKRWDARRAARGENASSRRPGRPEPVGAVPHGSEHGTAHEPECLQ